MRVLYFSDTFLPKVDGVALSIKNFSERLSLKGHEFMIACPKYGEGDFSRINDNISVERFTSGSLPSYPDIKVVLPNPEKIKKLVKEFEPDLIHIHTPGLLGQYAISVSEKYGIPAIGTYHTLMAEQNTYVSFYRLLKLDKLFMKINKFNKALSFKDLLKFQKLENFNLRKKIILKLCNNLYERCDMIISPSHLLKEQLLEYGIEVPISVISNGMDLSRFKGSVKSLPEAPKLLHVGRISYEKNCDVIINTFNLVLEKIPNATLTIIGEGPAISSLKIQTEKLGLVDKIIFKGFIDNSTLHEIYPQYDLFLTASTMETQGLVILEAISCGLPAIGVKSFAIPELIQDNRNGYCATPFEYKELSARVIEVLTSPDLYKKFSEGSLEISQTHEINGCVDKMEQLYFEVAKIKNKEKKNHLMNLFM
jgi:glycosyltransferase involved in cell wall biosynthesis